MSIFAHAMNICLTPRDISLTMLEKGCGQIHICKDDVGMNRQTYKPRHVSSLRMTDLFDKLICL